ncbi:hypothetical protein DFP73DRAFT_568505 [Morchella snyderi]|nr:hypothetical protein DFP73DRAFT_568505 [Morchella snyderi]
MYITFFVCCCWGIGWGHLTRVEMHILPHLHSLPWLLFFTLSLFKNGVPLVASFATMHAAWKSRSYFFCWGKGTCEWVWSCGVAVGVSGVG